VIEGYKYTLKNLSLSSSKKVISKHKFGSKVVRRRRHSELAGARKVRVAGAGGFLKTLFGKSLTG
jgi:hypothetical protein